MTEIDERLLEQVVNIGPSVIGAQIVPSLRCRHERINLSDGGTERSLAFVREGATDLGRPGSYRLGQILRKDQVVEEVMPCTGLRAAVYDLDRPSLMLTRHLRRGKGGL